VGKATGDGIVSAVAAGLQWLDATLTGDTTYMGYLPGGVYRSKAPVGATFPLSIINPQSLMDYNSATALRIYSPDLFLVKGVGDQAGLQALINAADRAYVLLNKVNATVSNGIILACYREQEFYYNEVTAGIERIHLGGLYRLQIK
jgi:hypothetical protein